MKIFLLFLISYRFYINFSLYLSFFFQIKSKKINNKISYYFIYTIKVFGVEAKLKRNDSIGTVFIKSSKLILK
jgi:hypothetical protein